MDLINVAKYQNGFFVVVFLTQAYIYRFFKQELHRISDYRPNDFMFSQMTLTLQLSNI